MNTEDCYEIIQNSHPRLVFCERFDEKSDTWDFTRHSHPYIELIFYLEGISSSEAGGHEMPTSAYDTLVFPADMEHQDGLSAERLREIVCLWVDIPQLILEEPIILRQRDNAINSTFLFILNEYKRSDSNPFIIENAVKSLLIMVLREASGSREKNLPLSNAIPYIEGHFSERITIGKLAEMEHISRSYLTRQFKRHTGTTVIAYVNRLRIEASKRLLISSSYSTSEIAYQVGFESPKYFHRVFKKETGYSPSFFRKMYKI